MLLVCRRSFHLEMSGKRQGEVMNLQIKTI
ncbi:hypothetical protein CGH34_19195, partial [Vibrio parahaemolyticus]